MGGSEQQPLKQVASPEDLNSIAEALMAVMINRGFVRSESDVAKPIEGVSSSQPLQVPVSNDPVAQPTTAILAEKEVAPSMETVQTSSVESGNAESPQTSGTANETSQVPDRKANYLTLKELYECVQSNRSPLLLGSSVSFIRVRFDGDAVQHHESVATRTLKELLKDTDDVIIPSEFWNAAAFQVTLTGQVGEIVSSGGFSAVVARLANIQPMACACVEIHGDFRLMARKDMKPVQVVQPCGVAGIWHQTKLNTFEAVASLPSDLTPSQALDHLIARTSAPVEVFQIDGKWLDRNRYSSCFEGLLLTSGWERLFQKHQKRDAIVWVCNVPTSVLSVAFCKSSKENLVKTLASTYSS